MAQVWSSHPWKEIYTIFQLLITPPYVAAMYFRYLWKPSHPEWNARMSLASYMLRRLFQYCQITQSRHVLDDDPTKAKHRLANIDPPPADYFSGVLAPTTVIPCPVKGVWLPEAPSSTAPDLQQDEKVIIHFPGGAFVITFGHEGSGRLVSGVLNKHLKASKLLWAQYRLAADEETCFPAAVQDALTYYNYVVSLGINPKNIILSGDSAGGNVVLALLRYLESTQQSGDRDVNGSSRTNTPALPLPGGAIVFSPWVEVTPNVGEVYSAYGNATSDILDPRFLQWGAESYLGKNGAEGEAAPYTSPLNYPFKTSVPIYIHVGAAEGFCQSVTSFAGSMQRIGGNRVGFYATAKAPHDLLLSHPLFDMERELCAVVDEARNFFDGGK